MYPFYGPASQMHVHDPRGPCPRRIMLWSIVRRRHIPTWCCTAAGRRWEQRLRDERKGVPRGTLLRAHVRHFR